MIFIILSLLLTSAYCLTNQTAKNIFDDPINVSLVCFSILIVFSWVILVLKAMQNTILQVLNYLTGIADIIVLLATYIYICTSYGQSYYNYVATFVCSIITILTSFIVYDKYSKNKSFINIGMYLTTIFTQIELETKIDFMQLIIMVLVFLTLCFCWKTAFGDIKCRQYNEISLWITMALVFYFCVNNFAISGNALTFAWFYSLMNVNADIFYL